MEKLLICDDDLYIHTYIREEVKKILGEIQDVKFVCFNSGQNMLESGEVKNAYGCFMDIELGGENGIQIAKELYKQNENIKIFFVSNYESFVFESIHIRPVRFIRKKYLETEIHEAANYIKNDLSVMNETVVFNSGKKRFEVIKKKILYIESNGHYINIYCENNCIRVRGKISDYYEGLEKMDFIQIQKGIVINMEYIDQICRNHIILKGGERFNISRERQLNVQKVVMKFLRKEM